DYSHRNRILRGHPGNDVVGFEYSLVSPLHAIWRQPAGNGVNHYSGRAGGSLYRQGVRSRDSVRASGYEAGGVEISGGRDRRLRNIAIHIGEQLVCPLVRNRSGETGKVDRNGYGASDLS